jgi:protein involved in polysaccharide export with SLBB domain
VGALILRRLRLTVFAVLAVSCSIVGIVTAQVPAQLQQQIELLNALPASERQALISQLVNQLPAAERNTLFELLQQQGGQTPGSRAQAIRVDTGSVAPESRFGLEEIESEDSLRADDTLVIEFEIRGTEPTASAGNILAPAATEALGEFLVRLEGGNPYQLNGSGQLYLPGVPAIALAGLNIDQATTRLRAARELRPFNLTITHLPLEPVGTDALEAYGYSLFRGERSSFAQTSEMNIPVPVNYVVGPGDVLNVQLFGSANRLETLEVGRDGSINFPQIGPLNVAGLSLADVRTLISDRVQDAMTGVNASTTLGELRLISVFVLGDVSNPGSYTISSLATMTNALVVSGGIADIGSLRRVALNRDGQTVSTLDLYDLLLGGDSSSDLRLQQGDVVFVPPVGETVAIEGEVRRPAVYELNGEASVAEMIELAGGLTANANRSSVKLERIVPGRGVSVADLSLEAQIGGGTPLQDGDILRVEANIDQLNGAVRLVGNVQRPGLYQWTPGMTVRALLPTSDLVKPMSDLNYVLIRRESTPNVDLDAFSVDLAAVWQERPGVVDLTLEPRDTIYVFHLETGRQQYVGPIIDELEAQADPNEALPVVRIGGQVRAEGYFPLEPGMRISDLLRAGGGLTDSAYAIEAELARYSIVAGEYRETALVDINLASIVAGDDSANVPLSPYDFLNIKEISGWGDREAVTLRGEFVFPGTYPIRPGETLSSVIERSGGLSDFAFPEGSVFTRVELKQRERAQLEALAQRVEADLTSLSLSDQGASDALSTGQSLLTQLRTAEATGRLVIRLDALIAGNVENDILLQDGDELLVPEFRQEVTVIGEVQYPTSHTFETGLSRGAYIERSGGLTLRADEKRIYIVRANGEVVVDRGGRWFRRDTGVEVQPGDTVVAPLEVDRIRPLSLWGSVTSILYNLAVSIAAVNSF